MTRGILRRTTLVAGALAWISLLAACAAPTPYQPVDGGYGYGQQQLEDNRYRITFAGNADTPRETVQNYLLFRAAEVTLESGHDYFTMVGQDVERSTRYFGTFDPAFPYYGRAAFTRGYPYGLVGAGSYTTHPIDNYSAFADILVSKGEKPADDVNAYDARDVIERLRPLVVRTPA